MALIRRDRFDLLFALLVAVLLLTGLDGPLAQVLVAVTTSLALLVLFLSAGFEQTRLSAVVLVTLAALSWLTAFVLDPDKVEGAAAWILQAIILGLVIGVVLRRIVNHRRVTAQTIFGALSVYILIGLIFGMVFGAMEAVSDEILLAADDGTRDDPIYYSFVTLTTLGFGDVTSVSSLVRRVTVVEAIVGQVFLATMVARVVSMYGAYRTDDSGSEAS